MDKLQRNSGQSGDLFGKIQLPPCGATVKPPQTPAFIAARSLCRQLRRKQAPHDKQRITHLICLNLLSMLKHGS